MQFVTSCSEQPSKKVLTIFVPGKPGYIAGASNVSESASYLENLTECTEHREKWFSGVLRCTEFNYAYETFTWPLRGDLRPPERGPGARGIQALGMAGKSLSRVLKVDDFKFRGQNRLLGRGEGAEDRVWDLKLLKWHENWILGLLASFHFKSGFIEYARLCLTFLRDAKDNILQWI